MDNLSSDQSDKDVVTPLLKANLPTRIGLRVEGERNSKIILDEERGENLLGHGDLLWKHGGGMIRLQGTFVTKMELEKLLRLGPLEETRGRSSQWLGTNFNHITTPNDHTPIMATSPMRAFRLS